MIWRLASKGVFPGADKTMSRPFLGKAISFVAPKAISISRKRDHTWDYFMECLDEDSLVAIVPEGRMMRRTGLDLQGNPMSVKGGVADILETLDQGNMVIGYSAGLHHIQAPGEGFPKVFKRIVLRCEQISISEYKEKLKLEDKQTFQEAVVKDLESRRDKICPPLQKLLEP